MTARPRLPASYYLSSYQGEVVAVTFEGVTDFDVRRLMRHLEVFKESLQELSLSGDRVSDMGLMCLKGLPHLRRLTLIGTSVTDAGAARLRKQLPQLEVVRLPSGSSGPPLLPLQ